MQFDPDDYQEYLHSPAWKEKAEQVKNKQGGVCGLCFKSNTLEVHHLTYARLGHEKDSDLVGLCQSCHFKVHEIARCYEKDGIDFNSSVIFSWRDAKELRGLHQSSECVLCNADENLNTKYDIDSVYTDLSLLCDKCQLEVFKIAAVYSARFTPRTIALAYALRDAKRNVRYKLLGIK